MNKNINESNTDFLTEDVEEKTTNKPEAGEIQKKTKTANWFFGFFLLLVSGGVSYFIGFEDGEAAGKSKEREIVEESFDVINTTNLSFQHITDGLVDEFTKCRNESCSNWAILSAHPDLVEEVALSLNKCMKKELHEHYTSITHPPLQITIRNEVDKELFRLSVKCYQAEIETAEVSGNPLAVEALRWAFYAINLKQLERIGVSGELLKYTNARNEKIPHLESCQKKSLTQFLRINREEFVLIREMKETTRGFSATFGVPEISGLEGNHQETDSMIYERLKANVNTECNWSTP